MCDNVAATWSNLDTLRSQIEYEVRHKIYNEIKPIVEASKAQGLSNHFIAGLECAQAKVLRLETDNSSQGVLF